MPNPFVQLADILGDLTRIAGKNLQIQVLPNSAEPIPKLRDQWTRGEKLWQDAQELARTNSVQHGIPFDAFDPVLIDAEKAMRMLLHISAGDVQDPALRLPNLFVIEKRLRQLARTYSVESPPPLPYSVAHVKSALCEYVETIEARRDEIWAALRDSSAGTSPRLRALELKRDWCPDEFLQALHHRARLELEARGLQADFPALDHLAGCYERLLTFAGGERFGMGDDIAREFLELLRALDKVRPMIPAGAGHEDAAAAIAEADSSKVREQFRMIGIGVEAEHKSEQEGLAAAIRDYSQGNEDRAVAFPSAIAIAAMPTQEPSPPIADDSILAKATSADENEPPGNANRESEGEPPGWEKLGEAKRSILQALKSNGNRLDGKELARKAGYSYLTLRRHTGDLQRWRYMELNKDGYAITSLGAELVPM